MRSTFSLLPYINRSKVRADGTTAVLCRITIDGKQTAISTGIYCRPEDWNGRKNEIKTVRENNRLREYLRLTEEAYTEILKSQGVVSAEMLKNHISLNNIHPTTLLQMGDNSRSNILTTLDFPDPQIPSMPIIRGKVHSSSNESF